MKTAKKAWRKELKIIKEQVLCDICGSDCRKQEIKHLGQESSYDSTSVTVEAREGSRYPEADCRTVYDIDICIICFLKKVKPAIEKLGGTFREHDAEIYDYYDKEYVVEEEKET